MEWEDDFFEEDEFEEAPDKWPPPWRVILHHDVGFRFEDVVYEVQHAIGSSAMKAVELTLSAHKDGYAVIYEGDFFDCHTVVEILRKAKLTANIYG